MSRSSELKSQLISQKGEATASSRSAVLKKILADQKATAAKKKASVTSALTVKPNYALSDKGTKEAETAQINTANKTTSANAKTASKSNFEKNLFSSAAASNERTALIEAARQKSKANAAAKKAALAAEKAAQATAVAQAVTPKVSDINRSAANVDYTPEISASESNYKAANPVIEKPKFKNYTGGASQVGASFVGGVAQSAAALADAAKTSLASEEDNPVFKYIDNAKKMLKTLVTGKALYPESKQITAEDYDTDKIEKYYLSGNTVQDKAETFSQKLMQKAQSLGDKQVSDGILSLASSAGYMIPSQIANAIIPSSGLSLLFVSGYARGNQQAIKAGASADEANAYALLSGLNDSAGELISGGLLGKGKGAVDSLLKAVGLDLTKYITNPVLKSVSEYIVSSLGEGGEEVLQGLFDTASQRFTYNKNASVDAGQLVQEGALGAAMGGLYGSVTIPSKIAYNTAVNASGQSKLKGDQLPTDEVISPSAKPSAYLSDYYANELSSLRTKTRTGDEEFRLREIDRAVNETERTGILYEAPEETVKTAARLSKASNIPVVFFKSEAYNGTISNGFTKDGVIYLNSKSQKTAPWIFAHELSDNLEGAKAFSKLQKLVQSRIPDYDAQKETLISTYAKAGIKLSTSDADRELVSNYAGDNLFTDEESIYNAVRQDRTTGEKIRDWLSSMIKKLTGTDEEKFLVKARNLYVKALSQTIKASMKAKSASIETENQPSSESKGNIRSDNFKKWFGDWENSPDKASKAVDKDGKPLTLYHGTNADFTEFNSKYIGSNTGRNDNARGFYFSSEKSGILDGGASWYGDKIMQVHLDIKKPLLLTDVSRMGLLKLVNGIAPDKTIGGHRVSEILDVYDKIYNSEWEISDGRNGSVDVQVEHEGRTYTLRNVRGDVNKQKDDIARYFVSDILDVTIPVRLSEYRIDSEIHQNYDGVINGTEYVVFSPTQIKSATDNIGTYDAKNPDIRYSVSKSDDAYMQAVENGDTDTAQKMVDESAKKSGYLPWKVWHGSKLPGHTVFDPNFAGAGAGQNLGVGVYFSEDPIHAARFAGKILSDPRTQAAKTNGPWKEYDSGGGVLSAYVKDGKILDLGLNPTDREDLGKAIKKHLQVDPKDPVAITRAAKAKGYEGIAAMEAKAYQVVMFDANDFKSADPITYDDSGNVIPLSQRFNKRSDDIRYSVSEAQETALTSRKVTGDEYDNAIDLAEQIISVKGEITADAKAVLYHATTQANADKINKTGRMFGKEDNLFFSTKKDGQIQGYGDAVVRVELPLEKLELNDVFKDELHLTMAVKVGKYTNIRYSITPDDESKPNTRAAVNTSEDVTAAKQERATVKQLEAENKKLKEQNEAQRRQFKLTTTFEPKASSVMSYVRQLKKGYNSTVTNQTVFSKMKTLFEYMANGNPETGVTAWEEAYAMAKDVAGDILSNSRVISNESELEQYGEIKKYLKDKTFYVNPESEANFGDFKEFKDKVRGKLKITSDASKGTSADELYSEMTDLYGEDLFPSDIVNPNDQLAQIADVAESLNAVYENPYTGKTYDAAEAFVASDILEQFYEVPQEPPTFADKAKSKLDAEKAKSRGKIKELKSEVSDIKSREYKMMMRMQSFVSNMSRSNTKAMEKLEKSTAARVMKEAESEIKSEYKTMYYRNGIKKASKKMMSWLLHPSKDHHIPDSFVKSLQDVFEASKYSAYNQKSAVSFEQSVNNLIAAYSHTDEDLPDIGFSADPDMLEMLKQLSESASEKSFEEFTVKELKNFYDVVRSMHGFITSGNKAFTDARKRGITAIASSASSELTAMKQKNQKRAGTWARNSDAVLNYSMLEPRTFFRKLGPTMYERYTALEKGLGDYINTSKETIRAAKKAIGKNNTSKWDGKNAEMIEVKELGVTISPAVLMNLYVLGNRAQAQGHIFSETGGAALKNFGDSKAGKPVRITEEQYRTVMEKYLTPEMKATADALQKYLSENMSAKGNEVTREIYNYSKFTEPDYWPIHVYEGVLPSVRGAELRQNQGEPNIENKGFTKSTQKGAKNPIEVGSIFDDFDQHTVEMAAYNAYLPALLDFKNVMNAKDAEGITVMSRIEDTAGTDASKYIRNFLRLVNQSRISANLWNTSDAMGKKLLRNVKAAMVGFNASVVLMQPISYIKANTVISPKYLTQALRLESPKTKKQLESEMITYSPVANIKDWGYADMGFGKNQRQLYDKSVETLGDKWSNIAGNLPSWADKRTWIRLWSACKLEYMSKHKGDPIDFTAVADRFDNLIYDTQVVNTIFSTSQILNEGTAYSSMLTAFGAESLKSYNMEYNAMKNGSRRAAARTTAALIFNGLIVAAMRTAFAHYRSKDDEDETSPLSLLGETALNMVGDASGMIIFLRDMQDLAQGYESTRMDMEGLSAVADALSSTVTDLGKVFAGEEPKGTVYSHLKDIVKGISYTTGISISNIWRDAESMVRFIAQDFNHPGMEYNLLQALYNPEYTGNKGHYYDLLYKYQEDDKVYHALYKDLAEQYGYDEDSIKTAMQNRASKEPDYVKAYDSSVEKMEGLAEKSAYYGTLSESMKEYVTEQITTYARATTLDKTYEPYTVPDGILRAKEMIEDGLSAGNYLMYKAAMKKAEILGDNNGSMNSSEKIKAMRDISFMSDSDRETLFTFMETDASGDTGRSDEMEALTDAGMTFDQFLDVYEKYSELNADDNMEIGDKALTFSKWTDNKFKDYAVDIGAQFDFWTSIPVEAKQYDKLKTAGISEDDAFTVSSAINELDPTEEGKSVTVYQKYDAIVGTDIKDSVKLKAIGTIMGETGYVKMTKAVLSGVNINSYIKYVYASSRIVSDTKKGKSISDSKKIKLLTYIDSLPLTKKQKDVLYEASGYAESELKADAPWYNGKSYAGDIYKKKVDGVAFTVK